MFELWSYAYAYDDPYIARLTSFLRFAFCFNLVLMLMFMFKYESDYVLDYVIYSIFWHDVKAATLEDNSRVPAFNRADNANTFVDECSPTE